MQWRLKLSYSTTQQACTFNITCPKYGKYVNLMCECPPNHIFDSQNNICTKIFGSYRENDHYRSESGDSELICAQNRCRCRSNYKISEDNHFCAEFKCLKILNVK